MATFTESFFLLFFDEQHGYLPFYRERAARFGSAAAVLFELALKGNLIYRTVEKRWEVCLSTQDGRVSDRALKLIDVNQPPSQWIHQLSAPSSSWMDTFTDYMKEEGILAQSPGRSWRHPFASSYWLTDTGTSFYVRLAVRSVALFCQPPTTASALALMLLNAFRQLPLLFDAFERGEAKRSIAQLSLNLPVPPEPRPAINELFHAIFLDRNTQETQHLPQ